MIKMDLSDLNALKQDTNSFSDLNGSKGLNTSQSINNLQQQPPPIPPRANISPAGFNNYATQFNTNSLYNNYSNAATGANYYSNYSNYSSPFASPATYGLAANASSNRFLRAAEDSSRSAFQSIESVVHAFSAVSAMFESTYYAVYNSFRAVVGVADQFYRLKTHLSSILSALAVVRFLKYLMRKLLRMLRLINIDYESKEDLWRSMEKNLADSEKFVKQNQRRQTNWPLIMFFGVVFGGPWLIWKILSSIESINKDDNLWMNGKIDHFIAVSEYDFDSVNVDELSFRRGQRIIIAPKEYQPKLRGWLLGSVDGKTSGIMPANYLKILGKKIGENSANLQKSKTNSNSNNLNSNRQITNENMEKLFDEMI